MSTSTVPELDDPSGHDEFERSMSGQRRRRRPVVVGAVIAAVAAVVAIVPVSLASAKAGHPILGLDWFADEPGRQTGPLAANPAADPAADSGPLAADVPAVSSPAPSVSGSASPSAAGPAGGAAAPPAAEVSGTLRVRGNQLLDTCGRQLVVRGMETFVSPEISVNGSSVRLVQEMVGTGVNAVRLIPTVSKVSVSEIDQFFVAAERNNVVVFLTPRGGNEWFHRADVKAMLDKHKKNLIIDAFGEPDYDDRSRWFGDVTAAIKDIRSAGYTVPVVVLANQFGRDLPSLLERGAQIVATDPQRNTILGWQAYWGKGGFYQDHYGMSLEEGVRRSAQQSFPIQIGIDRFADPGSEMDYPAAMRVAQQAKVGWLWWDWYNPFGNTDNLTQDGTAGKLTALGREVLSGDPAGIRATTVKPCGR